MDIFACTRIETTNRLRDEVFNAMSVYMSAQIMQEALLCAKRLLTSLPRWPLKKNKVFVAYGGGKDSSYMVAFVRFLQLLLFRDYQDTFQLRIATNRHAGMPVAVMRNIDQIYRALGLYEDPDAELLLIDADEVKVFNANTPLPERVRERNRIDILMTGHQCEGEARPTFCNACNLSMANSFGIAASYEGGVDIVVTGDSDKELRTYIAWVHRVAAKFGLPKQQYERGLRSFLQTMDKISLHYFQDIYGENALEELEAHRIQTNSIERDPLFFSIYRDTDYQVGSHWKLLIDFLGFQFDEIAFSFTESDCANPALMAHLRGLKAERVHERAYREGVNEYVTFATGLMRKKDFPEQLIDVMRTRYNTPEAVNQMRAKLDQYTRQTLDLSESELICMLYSPFVQRGKNLSTYLVKEKPELSNRCGEIHQILAGQNSETLEPGQQELAAALTTMTHLTIERLQTLYSHDISLYRGSTPNTPIAVILSRDPHKAIITTRRTNGKRVSEMISGR